MDLRIGGKRNQGALAPKQASPLLCLSLLLCLLLATVSTVGRGEPTGSFSSQFKLSPWSTSLAEAWAEVFRGQRIGPDASIVEVAPGQSPKVGVGLKMAQPDFRGTLYVVEPTQQSLEAIVAKYQTLFPKARVVGIPKLMTEITEKELPKGAFLAANHPMDDFITGSVMTRLPAKGRQDFQELFQAMYDPANEMNDVKAIKKIWDWLEAHPEVRKQIQQEVVKDWKTFVERFRPGQVAVAQYPSKFNTAHGLAAADKYARETLGALEALLPAKSSITERHLEGRGHTAADWIVSDLSPLNSKAERVAVPEAVTRLGEDRFVTERAHRLRPDSVSLLAMNQELAVHLFGPRARDSEWLRRTILENYAIDTRPGKGPTTGEVLKVWVDRQADGPTQTRGISMSGNLGSGRAVYTGSSINVKGLPTSLIGPDAKPGHRNGRESTLIALQEYLLQNGTSNLGAENNQILAVIDLKRTADFEGFGESGTSLIIRVDGGTMDRPSHLFEGGVGETDLMEVARRFGAGDAKRFMHRMIHGAWSAGNISLQGGILDAETVSSVASRAPVHSRTRKFEDNWFGQEGQGQMKILADLVEAKGDPKLEGPAREAFSTARTEELQRQFLHFMGLRANEVALVLSDPKLKAETAEMVREFSFLSTRIFPDYKALFPKTLKKSGLPVFDFSRFLRRYHPGETSTAQGFGDLFNNEGSLTPTEARKPLPEGIERFVVKDPTALEALKARGKQFVSRFDGFHRALREQKIVSDVATAVGRARVLNDHSPYLEVRRVREIARTLLAQREAGTITDRQLRDAVELVRLANHRVPIRDAEGSFVSQVRLFKEGQWFETTDRAGKHRLNFVPHGLAKESTAVVETPGGGKIRLTRTRGRYVSEPLTAAELRQVDGIEFWAPPKLDGVGLSDMAVSEDLSGLSCPAAFGSIAL